MGDTNTYTVTAPDLVFDVTDAGTRYLITKVEDTRSPSPKLDFRFQGDEPIDVRGLKVGVFSASSKNNDISVTVPNDLVVGVIDAGTGNVTLSSGGMINDDQDDNLADIIANRVTLTAQTGIGVVNGNLDLSALQITLVTTQTGGINLQSLLPSRRVYLNKRQAKRRCFLQRAVGETDAMVVAKESPVPLEPAPDPLQRITQCLEGVAG